MKDVWTVFVDIDAFHFVTIEVASQLWTFVNHQTAFSPLRSQVCKDGTIESCTNNQIVVFHNSGNIFRKSTKNIRNMQTF
jgi:hypothetical protein